MKKIFTITILTIAFLIFSGSTAKAASFFDDFNDGNLEGWVNKCQRILYACHFGNWRIEDGILKQNAGGDGYILALDGVGYDSQTITTKMLFPPSSGGGGVTFWYQDENNYTMAIFYPAGNFFAVLERVNGVNNEFHYAMPSSIMVNAIWYEIKIEADSNTGNLKVYINNVLSFTHTATTPTRSGLTGFNSGNSGTYNDWISIEPLIQLTNMDQCKKDGWKTFTNPVFKNQGQCVSFVQSKHEK